MEKEKLIPKLAFVKLLASKTNEEIWECLGDYHTIFSPEFFIEFGFDEDLIKSLEFDYKSNTSHWKSTITNDEGEVLKTCKGVMATSVVDKIAHELGINTYEKCNFFGRGKQHRCELRVVLDTLKGK